MAVIGLDHVQIAIPPGQEEIARSFYIDLLGLVEICKPADLIGRGGMWLQCGSMQLHLGVEAAFLPAKKAHPGLLVDDLACLTERLQKSGWMVRTDTPIAGFDRIFTEDPFGNRIELLQSSSPPSSS